ncbi:hypothetical protein [Allobaculum sp. Allo2]|uniref:hypothetical protein n=1 Tax=Allobaculum sp. Allo2 TaxID=2853432 RepID=UPI001F6259FB|nr:hypothetical protein [Allobaculum sp. Allo2]UNT93831.1 hypothetical protein KWG61_03675 [Allobaculum sp. Allo2]
MKLITLRQLEAQARTGDGKACLALYQEYSNNTRDEKPPESGWISLSITMSREPSFSKACIR